MGENLSHKGYVNRVMQFSYGRREVQGVRRPLSLPTLYVPSFPSSRIREKRRLWPVS